MYISCRSILLTSRVFCNSEVVVTLTACHGLPGSAACVNKVQKSKCFGDAVDNTRWPANDLLMLRSYDSKWHFSLSSSGVLRLFVNDERLIV